MSVIFIRVKIISTDTAKLDAEKIWFDNRVTNSHLHVILEGGTPNSNVAPAFEGDDPTFQFDIYVKNSVDADDYKSSFNSRLTALDKTAVSLVECIHNDSCSHDESSPIPDVVTAGYSYP